MPEYSEHIPMKKKTLDMNNVNDEARQKDHTYSDIFGPSKNRPQSSHHRTAEKEKIKNVGQGSNW